MALTAHILLNKWTAAFGLTVFVWLWYWLLASVGNGDYDFGPALFGLLAIVCTVCLWAGLIVGSFL